MMMSAIFQRRCCALPLAIIPVCTLAGDPKPVGPELAPKQVGELLRAYPITVQQNPMAPGGVGTLLWGCDYQVGNARITLTIATQAGDPMPCKRRVAFE